MQGPRVALARDPAEQPLGLAGVLVNAGAVPVDAEELIQAAVVLHCGNIVGIHDDARVGSVSRSEQAHKHLGRLAAIVHGHAPRPGAGISASITTWFDSESTFAASRPLGLPCSAGTP
jgi:hypothetical protein